MIRPAHSALRLRSTLPSLPSDRCSRRSAVFLASKFHDILSAPVTRTASAFDGLRLARLTPNVRGNVFARVARRIDSERHPNSYVADAIPGLCMNGKPRGVQSAAYDWRRDTTRIECKSAQIQWDRKNSYWLFRFQGVKLSFNDAEAPFDELHLVLFTPEHVHICRHDLSSLGVAGSGLRNAIVGHAIQLIGPKWEADWRVAFSPIVEKLASHDNACVRIAELSLDDRRIREALAECPPDVTGQAFAGTLLADHTPAARGAKIQSIVRMIDSLLHPNLRVDDATAGMRVDGRRRSKQQTAYDWTRDGMRVECKSGQLSWSRRGLCWQVRFNSIKVGLFDDLLLVIYHPHGLLVYRYADTLNMTLVGKATDVLGKEIRILGEKFETDWSAALCTIRSKLERQGCEFLAMVAF